MAGCYMYVTSLHYSIVLLVVIGFVGWREGFDVWSVLRASFSVLLLLLLTGSSAVAESHSFDKHFITFHCCSSCAEKHRSVAVLCCMVSECCICLGRLKQAVCHGPSRAARMPETRPVLHCSQSLEFNVQFQSMQSLREAVSRSAFIWYWIQDWIFSNTELGFHQKH